MALITALLATGTATGLLAGFSIMLWPTGAITATEGIPGEVVIFEAISEDFYIEDTNPVYGANQLFTLEPSELGSYDAFFSMNVTTGIDSSTGEPCNYEYGKDFNVYLDVCSGTVVANGDIEWTEYLLQPNTTIENIHEYTDTVCHPGAAGAQGANHISMIRVDDISENRCSVESGEWAIKLSKVTE